MDSNDQSEASGMTQAMADPVSKSSAAKAVLPLIAAVLDEVFDPTAASPWALLDFPGHANVGDSAIWLGTLALLDRRFDQRPAYVTRHCEFPTQLDSVMPEGPVLLHGGGNFGDLWPGYWQNRVALLTRFRHRRIVQMPQSIHFTGTEKDALLQTQRAIAGHPDFTLLVRDTPSLDFAQRHFDCPVHLCPDMAFGLERLSAPQAPHVPVLALMRTDPEGIDHGPEAASLHRHAMVEDWVGRHKHPLRDRIAPKLCRKVPQLARHLMRPQEAAFRRQAERHLHRGTALLGKGDVVVTDRLHGHILCSLMGKPHVVLDNSYGKLSNYIETWPDDGLTWRASSLAEAATQLRQMGVQLPSS